MNTLGETVLALLAGKGRRAATKYLTENGYTFREADEYVLTVRNSQAGQALSTLRLVKPQNG